MAPFDGFIRFQGIKPTIRELYLRETLPKAEFAGYRPQPVASTIPAIGHGFGDMKAADTIARVEIGERRATLSTR